MPYVLARRGCDADRQDYPTCVAEVRRGVVLTRWGSSGEPDQVRMAVAVTPPRCLPSRLTNVSVIRLKRGGKRFEVRAHARARRLTLQIACYKNKVREWRSGVETDLDEVLQVENVFINVSKGQLASKDDLQKAFGTSEVPEVIREILQKGELQVGEKERSHELSSLWLDIATQVAQMCVDPGSQRPYTVGMIEKAMKDIHYSVKTGKSAKSQALDVIKQLQAKNTISIERSRMRVRVTLPTKEAKRLKDKVVPLVEKVEDEDWADEWELVAVIDPGSLRQINEFLETDAKGEGSVETLASSALDDEDDAGW